MLEAGSQAPPFTLAGTDGREYRLPRDLRGGPALLFFMKTTCGTCDLTVPYVNRLRNCYPAGWELWAIAQDPPAAAAAYAARHGMTYPVLIDAPHYTVSRLYDPPATPTLFLLAPDGRVQYTTHGFAKDDLNEISRRLAGYVSAQPQEIAPADVGYPRFKPG